MQLPIIYYSILFQFIICAYRSFLYLHSAKLIYDNITCGGDINLNEEITGNKSAPTGIVKAKKKELPDNMRQTVEDLYTHNLFYLAQAYGHIGRPDLSCKYCFEVSIHLDDYYNCNII